MEFVWSEFRRRDHTVNFPTFRGSWHEFVQRLVFIETENKHPTVPLHNPNRFVDGGERQNEDVEAIYAATYDFDNITDDDLARLRETLAPFTHVIHTTFSHLQPGESNCLRVIVPFSRAATVGEWYTTKFAFGKAHNWPEWDPKTDQEHIGYYFPCHLPNSPHFIEVKEGRTLDVEPDDGTHKKGRSKPKGKGYLDSLKGVQGNKGRKFFARWKKIFEIESDLPFEQRKMAAELYDRYSSGLPIAEEGSRDNTLTRQMLSVANIMNNSELREIDEKAISDFLSKSLANTPGKNGDRLTADDVHSKLRTARRVVLTRNEGIFTSSEENDALLAGLIKHAPEWTIQPLPPKEEQWKPEERKALADKYFHGGKIVFGLRYKKEFFIFSEDGFSRSLIDEEVAQEAKQRRLQYAGIDYMTERNGRPEPMSGKQFIAAHGRVLPGLPVGAFYGISNFNWETETFTEVINPMRKVEAVFDEEIDMFLRLYCVKERDYFHLLAWLKRFPDLTLPNNVLFVYGPPGIGKSLIGFALARFWGRENGIKPEEFFGTFQESLVDCPFIIADEGLPKNMVNSEGVRSFATTAQHRVNRKFRSVVAVNGYARMFISANQSNSLTFSEDALEHDSVKATEARFLRIEVSDKILSFIRERGDREWTTTLVAGDRFIKHVQWLYENDLEHPVESDDRRFPAMTDPADRMHDVIRLNQKMTSETFAVVWRCLTMPKDTQVADARKDGLFLWATIGGKKFFCVSAQLVAQYNQIWNMATEGQKAAAPTAREMGAYLKNISDPSFKIRSGGAVINQQRYWPIDSSLLRSWAADSGIQDEAIDAALTPPVDPESQKT